MTPYGYPCPALNRPITGISCSRFFLKTASTKLFRLNPRSRSTVWLQPSARGGGRCSRPSVPAPVASCGATVNFPLSHPPPPWG